MVFLLIYDALLLRKFLHWCFSMKMNWEKREKKRRWNFKCGMHFYSCSIDICAHLWCIFWISLLNLSLRTFTSAPRTLHSTSIRWAFALNKICWTSFSSTDFDFNFPFLLESIWEQIPHKLKGKLFSTLIKGTLTPTPSL